MAISEAGIAHEPKGSRARRTYSPFTWLFSTLAAPCGRLPPPSTLLRTADFQALHAVFCEAFPCVDVDFRISHVMLACVLQIPPTVESDPWRPALFAKLMSHELITGELPPFVLPRVMLGRVTSPDAGLVIELVWGTGCCPCNMPPLLTAGVDQGKSKLICLAPRQRRSCQRVGGVTS